MREASGATPRATDLTATWPDAYRAEAAQVLASILAVWRERTEQRGEVFLVLYVPRSEPQLGGEISAEETWRPTLAEICNDLGIPLVDPGPDLSRRLAEGVRIYDDHWTPAGHEVVARVLGEALGPMLEHFRTETVDHAP
jgi:hypothetical protein